MDLFEQFVSNDFLPHGYCVAWQPGILWLHLISDAIIALAYYSIPLALTYFVAARKDLSFKWVFKLFIVFIVACGTTHLMSIITLWEPVYWIDGGVKVVTAGASLLTAALLWPLIPQALALPSRSQLEAINQELHKEIIERQQATEALKKSENLYRTLARHLPHMGVLLFDADLRFLIAEGEALTERGYLPQKVEGQTLWEVLPRQYAEMLAPHYQAALTGTDHTMEWHVNQRTYYIQVLPVKNEQGDIFAGLAVLQDITHRKQAEEKFRSLLEAAPEAMIIIDQSGEIILVNALAETLFGYDRADLLGKSVELLLPERFHQSHIQERKNYFAHPKVRPMGANLELYGRHKEGHEIPVEISLSPLHTEEGILVSSAIRDISEKKEAEALLREAKEAAEAASAAKTEFLANMSHELRTPLNGILGYAQILNRDERLMPKQQEAIRTIYRSGEHLLLMINDILDLSKIEVGKMELMLNEFHFPSFLQVIADIIQVRAEQKGLNFRYQSAPDLPVGLYADEKRLRQILLNLLGNAVKFTEKGEVTFRISRIGASSIPHVHRIRFEIEDTGVGISPENLDDIFQAFHQVRQPQIHQEGTGLGLAISRQLIHLMGSEIHVESQVQRGSLFWFELLLPEAVKVLVETKARTEKRVVGYKADHPAFKILVVDDRIDNRAVLRDILGGLGFTILEAANGQEGVARARQYRPDLILMDLVMPMLDGYEATRQIRRSFPPGEMVIIALSASVLDGSREKSLEAGCDDFMTKPLVIDDLLQQIQKHLGLSWVYSEAVPVDPEPETSDIPVPPPQATLKILRRLARIGDITALRGEIERLRQDDHPGLAMFGAKVSKLVEQFQLNEVVKFVELYLEEEA